MKNAPKISPAVLRFFRGYTRRFLARNFHSVLLSRGSAKIPACAQPTIIYLNHASWWDPLACFFIAEKFFAGRPSFAPMEAEQLGRYPIFRRLGMFGARELLRIGARVLSDPRAMIWLTPQARFADARERPIVFAGGLARLARRVPEAQLIPLALEYVFWEERRPELLLRFGEPLRENFSSEEILTHELERRLTETMDALRQEALARDERAFECLLRGGEGSAPIYDAWRRAKAFLRAEPFRAAHSTTSP